MSSTRHLGILTTLALTVACALTAPASAGGWFGVTIGDDDFALSFGAGDWAPYGAAWSDPGWAVDYRVSLSGYGEWVWVDGLGSVWRPWVAADWRPYSHGRWVWTSYGWTWVAYEPWGWLPHHYGSWALAPAGWVWVPGTEYRAANVVWVTSGSYVGWYPCAPSGWSHHDRGFRHGYHHGYRDGHHDGYRDGYRDGWDDAMEATWVDRRHVGADDLSHHAVNRDDVSRSFMRAKPAVLESGPSRVELDRHAERPIPEARVSTRALEVGGRQTVAVRPEGFEREVAGHSAATVRTALSPAVAQRLERQVTTAAQPRPEGRSSDRQPALRERTPSTSGPRAAATRAPAIPQRSSDRTVRTAQPAPTSSRVSVGRPAMPAQPSRVRDERREVRRAPMTPSPTRAEAAERQRQAPATGRAPEVDRRRLPATGAGERSGERRKPSAVRPAAPTAPEAKPEARASRRSTVQKPPTPPRVPSAETRRKAGGSASSGSH